MAEPSQTWFQTIIDAASDAMLVVDHLGVVRFANNAATELFERTREELQDIEFGFPVVAGDITEIDVLRKDGTIRYAEMRVTQLQWESNVQSLASLRDITERKQLQYELETLHHLVSHLFKSESLYDLGQKITDELARAFDSTACNLFLIDKAQNRVYPFTFTAADQLEPVMSLTLDSLDLVAECARTGTTQLIADFAAQTHYAAKNPATRCELVVPLNSIQGTIGVLDLQSRHPAAFSLSVQRILDAFAERAAAAIETKRLSDEVNRNVVELEMRVAQRTAALSYAKERVETILNSTSDGIVLLNADGSIQQTNPAFNILFGYQQDELVGISLTSLIQQPSPEVLSQAIYEVIHARKSSRLELVGIGRDQPLYYVEMALAPIWLGEANDIGVICSLRDITERKRAEEALAEERNLMRTLIDAVPDFIYAKDKQHRFILTNRAHADARGLSSPVGMMGKTDRDFFPPHLADEFFAEEQTLLLSGVPLLNHEQTSQGYHGGSNWVITNKVPLKNIEGEIVGLVGITRDISDRKLAEEALLESEQRFRNAVLHAPFPIMIHTEDGEVLHISDMWTEITGYTQAEIPTIRAWTERAYDRSKEDVTALIKKIMAPVEVVKAGEFEIHTKAGEKRIWDFVAAPVGHIADGRRIISTMAVDITDRKRAEDALRASEQRFYQVAENFDQVLYLQTVEDARLLYVNPRIETLAPIARDSFYIGENVLMSLFHPDDVQMLMQKLGTREYIEEDSIDVELRLLQSTHQLRWVRLRTFPIRDEHGVMQLRAGTLEDITERKAAQDALLKAFDKEKELNELKTRFVSMASHEFRTPLAGILATVETLKAYRHRMTNEQIDQKFDNINNRIDHLTMLTNDVLQLTRMQSKRITVNMAPLQLDAQCRILLDEFQARQDLKHELVYTCNDPARWITLDSKLIQQILTNLVTNAIKYSPNADAVFIHIHYTDTQVTITVRDTGIGIPEADFKHLFEPFHRAGNVGAIAGTGLGLVITKEAVEVQGGTITVESEVGQGTTFFITFPTQSQGVAHDEEDPRN